MPTKDTTNTPFKSSTRKEKCPSISVIVPNVVPLTRTPAPITGSPVSSFTTPETVAVWAKVAAVEQIHNNPTISFRTNQNVTV